MYDVKLDVNDSFLKDGDKVTVPQGFYTFSSLKKWLAGEGITIEKTATGGTKITSTENLDLKKFGNLLGFVPDKQITKDTATASLMVSALGLHMTKIDIHCSFVDTFKNFDSSGEPSDLLVSIPVDTEQPLYGSITHYDLKNIRVPCKYFYGHDINFEVESSDLTTKWDYAVTLRLGVEY